MAQEKTASKTAEAAAPALPEIRQCVDPEHWLFGSSATWSERQQRWGVMNPGVVSPDGLGGHWATDDEVKDWPTK